MDRRALLGGVGAAGAMMMLATPALGISPLGKRGSEKLHPKLAKKPDIMLPERRLAFRNVHTNERIDARFFGAHGYDAQGLAEIEHGLRDWRNGERHPIDRNLLVLLVGIRDRLDVTPRRPFDLISGYRSPQTNAMLREAGGSSTGVASRSQHLLGKATDIAMPGISLERLRDAAKAPQIGGVGYYPVDGFVHVDSGSVRSW